MTFTYGGAWKRPIPRSGTEVTMGQRWGGQTESRTAEFGKMEKFRE